MTLAGIKSIRKSNNYVNGKINNHIFNTIFTFLFLSFSTKLITTAYERLSFDLSNLSNNEVLIKQNLISNEDCDLIIYLAEKSGFKYNFDSIDIGLPMNENSQDLSVYDRGVIYHQALWDIISRYIESTENLVRQHRQVNRYAKSSISDSPNDDIRVDWVFLRKYSPTSPRNSLRMHCDSNENTVLIALNGLESDLIDGIYSDVCDASCEINDYKSIGYDGGGFFFATLSSNNNSDAVSLPHLMTDYDWLNSLKRSNTSVLHFPYLEKGSAVAYNLTLWHGVAPLISGTRYTVSIFFNEPSVEYVKELMRQQEDQAKNDKSHFESTMVFRNNYKTDPLLNVRYVEEITYENQIGEIVIDSSIEEWKVGQDFSTLTYFYHKFQICYGEYLIRTCEVSGVYQICDVNVIHIPPQIHSMTGGNSIYESNTRLQLCARLN